MVNKTYQTLSTRQHQSKRQKEQKRAFHAPENLECQLPVNQKQEHQIQNLADSTKPDVIIATETWLDPTITNIQIFPPNYNIYSKDRKGSKTGGGVLIAINGK